MTFPHYGDSRSEAQRMAEARAAMEARLESAEAIVSELLRIYRHGKPAEAAYVVQRMADTHDLQLLMLVIGGMMSRLIATERRADEAHGPLLTAAEQQGVTQESATELGPWAVSIADQMQAAVEAQDYQAAATIAVNGSLMAWRQDFPTGAIPFDYVMRSMLQLNQQNVAMCAAEAMRLLFNERNARA